MSAFWIVAAALTLVSVVALVLPLLRRRPVAATATAEHDLEVYRDQLAEVDAEIRAGRVGDAEAAAVRTEIARRMIGADARREGGSGMAARRHPLLAAILALAMPAAAAVLYWELGAPELADRPLAFARGEESPGGDPTLEHAVERLAAHLKTSPGDIRGWTLLANSYRTLGRYREAANAYRQARAGDPDDLGLAVGYAEALVLANGSQVVPEAQAIFQRLLADEPANPRARYYLGLERAQKGDYTAAVQAWTDLLAIGPAEGAWRPGVEEQRKRAAETGGIDLAAVAPSAEAKALAEQAAQASQVPQAPAVGAAALEAAEAMTAAERQAFIRSMVDGLAARLEREPGDADGWERLARAYQVLGESDKAAEASKRAAAARAGR